MSEVLSFLDKSSGEDYSGTIVVVNAKLMLKKLIQIVLMKVCVIPVIRYRRVRLSVKRL